MMSRCLALVGLAAGLAACSSVGLGISLPLGRIGGVGVTIDSAGRVGAGVSVGAGHATVGVGGSVQIPPAADPPASASRP